MSGVLGVLGFWGYHKALAEPPTDSSSSAGKNMSDHKGDSHLEMDARGVNMEKYIMDVEAPAKVAGLPLQEDEVQLSYFAPGLPMKDQTTGHDLFTIAATSR